MNLTDKPLHPLPFGKILIVGSKASNFDEELRTHPRIIMWDSQHESWTAKDIPHNVQSIFITRFIGHAAFAKILAEARRKRITIFNPEGTGMIVKQVRELLAMKVEEPVKTVVYDGLTSLQQLPKEPTVPQGNFKKRLDVLYPFIDFNLGNIRNAEILLAKANEMGVPTTLGSLAQLVSVRRRQVTGKGLKRSKKTKVVTTVEQPVRIHKYVDVAVEMLDNMVKELQDMRDYLVATTEENKTLKARIDKFKKALAND